MRLRFTYKDFLLLLGIMVAMIITITTLFYRESLLSGKPSFTKRIQASISPAVKLHKGYSALQDCN